MTKIFWHGSFNPLMEGKSLVPGDTGGCGDDDVEAFLERHRPGRCIARSKAVYLVDLPDDIDAAGGYTDCICAAEPLGETHRHDLAWVTRLQEEMEKGDGGEAERCAHSYWSGIAYPFQEESLFETLCQEAIVLQVWGEDEEPDILWQPSPPCSP